MSEDKAIQTAEAAVTNLVDSISKAIDKKDKRPTTSQTIKHVGQTANMVEKNSIVFLSLRKSLTLFKSDDEIIVFKARVFQTDNKEIINFIRNHSAFNSEVFEKEYPEHIKQKMKEDDKYITHDRKEYDSGNYT